jgi:hypothetical protein
MGMNSHLIIELLHNITRTWDIYGGPQKIPLFLTDESWQELKQILIIPSPHSAKWSYQSGNEEHDAVLSIDGYDIQIKVAPLTS